MNTINTLKLAKEARSGNVEAYGKLIEEYKEYLYKTAWLYVRDEQCALDIVQDSILKGFRQIKSLREPGYFKTWLTRILMNTAKDMLEKGRFVIGEEILDVAALNQKGSFTAKKDNTEERLDLYDAIGKLPEQYRAVIVLKYFNDMKISEIANILQIPEGTVSAYLTRAKQELKKILREDYRYA